MSVNITGILTAIITPFKGDKIDEQAFEKLIEYQIKNGINGLVPCGSTGECSTLSDEEVLRVIQLCADITKKRVPIIANVGSNNTTKTIVFAQKVARLNIDAVMIVVPYYNKPTQKGIYQHFKAIHDSTDLPIILYNVPGRTVTDMLSETVLKLTELVRIVAIKDATSDLTRPLQVLSQLKRKDFAMLSGEDATFVAFNASGGKGCISVASNAMPAQMVEIQKLCEQGNYHQALEKQLQLMPLYEILFCETNPVPIKYVLWLMGLCHEEVRLPLCKLSEQNKKNVKSTLEMLELI